MELDQKTIDTISYLLNILEVDPLQVARELHIDMDDVLRYKKPRAAPGTFSDIDMGMSNLVFKAYRKADELLTRGSPSQQMSMVKFIIARTMSQLSAVSSSQSDSTRDEFYSLLEEIRKDMDMVELVDNLEEIYDDSATDESDSE